MNPVGKYNSVEGTEQKGKISPYGIPGTNGLNHNWKYFYYKLKEKKIFGLILAIIVLICTCWLMYRLPAKYITWPWTNW